MKEEEKGEPCKKYPRIGSFSFKVPILNDEITGCLKKMFKQDKYFSITQNLMSTALATLVPIITILVASNTENSKKALSGAWNSARILATIDRSQTVARRACILLSLSFFRSFKKKRSRYLPIWRKTWRKNKSTKISRQTRLGNKITIP